MEEQIKQLLEFHKTAKLSCEYDIKDLASLITDEENKPLRGAINKLQQENSMRSSFISDLEAILWGNMQSSFNKKVTKEMLFRFNPEEDKF